MTQPSYTLWPWRVLALAVPALSGLGAWLVAIGQAGGQIPDRGEMQVLLVGLTLFGAGDALIIGMAIGDLGRTLIAVIAAAVGALVAVGVFKFQAIWIGPFVVIAIWSAAFALDRTPRGYLDAMGTAVWASIVAAFRGVIVLAASAVLGLIVSEISFRELGRAVASLGLVISILYVNHYFIGRLFRASFRVQAMPEATEAAPEEEEEDPGERMRQLKAAKGRAHLTEEELEEAEMAAGSEKDSEELQSSPEDNGGKTPH